MLLGPSQRFLGLRGWSRLRGSPRTVRTPVRSVKTSTVDWKPVRAVEGNLTTLEHQAKTPWLRRFFLGLMIAMPVISFTLGCWQVRRLRWKADLIAKCENNLAAETIPELPAQLDPDAIAEFEYRRFRCKGHFDYSQEMFLGPRMRDGHLGYLVVTPFVREAGGKPILVERGWISKEKVVPLTRDHGYLSHLALPQGEIEIEALFRVMPERSNLQFEHEPGSRLFNVHDVPAMSEQAGTLPIYAQMIYDMHDHPEYQGPDATKEKPSLLNKLLFKSLSDSEFMKNHDDDETMVYQPFEFVQQGVPIAAMPKLKFSNNHLQYLITWFGLLIGLAGLLLWSFMKKGKYSLADKVIEAKRRDMRQNF